MGILNEEELERLIRVNVGQKFEQMTKNSVQKQVDDFIKNEIDWKCDKQKITWKMERIIEEKVMECLPQFNNEYLEKLADRISTKIAEKLKDRIVETIACRLLPDDDKSLYADE